MPLPTSRNTTYAPGSQVLSADLNDLQDQIIGLADGTWSALQTFSAGIAVASGQHVTVAGSGRYKHGTMARLVPIVSIVGGEAFRLAYAAGYAVSDNAGPGIESMLPVDMISGERIVGASFRVQTSGSETITVELRKRGPTGGVVTLASGTSSFGSVVDETIVLTAAALPHEAVADETFWFYITKTAHNLDLRLYSGTVSYDRP